MEKYNLLDCCCESADIKTINLEEVIKFEEKLEIKGHTYQTNLILEESDLIFRILHKDWHKFQCTILYNRTIPYEEIQKLRGDINKCFKAITYVLLNCKSDYFKAQYIKQINNKINDFSSMIIPLVELTEIFMKINNNQAKCPVYQYLHTYLEIQYYRISFVHLYGNTEELRGCLELITQDLILLGLKNYRQNCKSAFLCSCIKQMWIFIRELSDENNSKYFWELFNKNIENQQNEFIIWILRDLVEICKEEHNYQLLENSIKNILTDTNPNKLLDILRITDQIICDNWIKFGKIEIYQIFWDYFSKRLNHSSKIYSSYSVPELIELMDGVLWAYRDCKEDFEYFLGMLLTHLTENPTQWGRMKGRIYSQLGPNKVKELNYIGVLHVSLLFVTLTRVNFDELVKRFISFIDSLPVEKKQSRLVWNFYLVFIIRHIRENRNIETIVEPFLKLIDESFQSPQNADLIKNFITDFEIVITNSHNLQLQQWHLINQWIPKFISSCHVSETVNIITILLNILERIDEGQVWNDWESSYKNYVYPPLKFICSSLEAPPVSGILAAKIVRLSPNLLGEAFNFFCNESIIPEVSSNFLSIILMDYPNRFNLTPNQEILALQVWTKASLLMKDSSGNLTKNILKLDCIPTFLKTVLKTAKDPISSLFENLSENLDEHRQSIVINRLIENCFGQADRWIVPYVTKCDNEAIILRIFTCIALAIHSIGPLLYNKHKTSCTFIKLMSSVILSTEVMKSKPMHPFVLQAIKKVWHLIFNGTVMLYTSGDGFIDRTLKDLVTKYIPYFQVKDSPMLKCLDNSDSCGVLAEKIANSFFKHPVQEPETNVFKASRLIHDYIKYTTNSQCLKIVIEQVLVGILEVIMFHSQRNVGLDVIKVLAASRSNIDLKDKFRAAIVSVTEKYLGFNTNNYYQMINLLVDIIPNDLKECLNDIKSQTSNLERMRGVGYDKTLRMHLERLYSKLV